MKIIRYTFEHRNDFSAVYECEHCGDQREIGQGYNDANYHQNVIPRFRCLACGKNRHGTSEEARYVGD